MADDSVSYVKLDDFTVQKTSVKSVTDVTTFTVDALQFEKDEWQRRKDEFSATCDAEIARLDAELTAVTGAGAASYSAYVAAQDASQKSTVG